MSSIAASDVDVVDANWRILQAEQPKVPTRRGRSRICSDGHRRTCYGHPELEKHNGQPKKEGRRMAIAARRTMRDLTDGLLEFFERGPDDDEEDEPQPHDSAVEHWQLEQGERVARAYELARFIEASSEKLSRRAHKRIRRIAAEMGEHIHAKRTLRSLDPETARKRVEEIETLMSEADTPEEEEAFAFAWIEAQLDVIGLEAASLIAA